jgi:hypothetical protein
MGYSVDPTSVVEVTIRGLMADQRIINTFHYSMTTPLTTDISDGLNELGQIVTEFDSVVCSPLTNLLTTELFVDSIRAQWIWPTRFAYFEGPSTTGGGTLAPPALPTGASLVLRRRGSLAGRHSQGRVFLAGVKTSQVVGSVLTSAADSAWIAIAGCIGQSFTTATSMNVYNPIVLNRTAPNLSQLVTQVYVDDIIRYQRRREVGKGE